MITITESDGNIDIKSEIFSYARKHASLCTIALACFKTIYDDTKNHDLLIDKSVDEFMNGLFVEFLENAAEIGLIKKERKDD